MAETRTVPVDAEELLLAFDFVSSGQPFEHNAYVCLDTGRIYWNSDALEADEDLPEDLEESDRYVEVPHKNELELGRRLVLAFVSQELPHDYRTVDAIFRRRGAYRRFKDLLQERGALERSKTKQLKRHCMLGARRTASASSRVEGSSKGSSSQHI